MLKHARPNTGTVSTYEQTVHIIPSANHVQNAMRPWFCLPYMPGNMIIDKAQVQ